MNVRESLEALEEQTLSPYASFSSRTRGRDHAEPLCDIRPEYQRDRHRRFFRMQDIASLFMTGRQYKTDTNQ